MEVLGIIAIPGWLLTIFLVCLSLYLYTTYKQSVFRRNGIPGPKPVLFLGCLPDIIKKGVFEMDIEYVRKHGKHFGTFIGNIPTILVADPEIIKEISVNQFSNFQDRTQSIANSEFWTLALNNAVGDHWRFLRNTISPSFSSGKLRKMEPILHKCLDSFVEVLDQKMKDTDIVDMQPVFGALTLDIVCSSSFGIESDSQRNPDDPFMKTAREVFNFNVGKSPLFMINFIFPETKHFLKYFDITSSKPINYIKGVTKKVIEERKASGSSEYSDLLQLMIDAHRDAESHHGEAENYHNEADDDSEHLGREDTSKRPLTDDEILANSIMFLLAGYDTTASTLTWLAYCLATNMEVQDKLIVEIDQNLGGDSPKHDDVMRLKYIDMVVSETLRMYTPTTRTNRQVVKDTVICGKKFLAGMSVTFPIAGIHRLPEFWPEPETFNPERFSLENKEKGSTHAYMPFGLGPRSCIGMRLALLIVKMAIVTLLQRYKIEPSDKLQIPPKVSKTIIVKPAEGILLKLTKRNKL